MVVTLSSEVAGALEWSAVALNVAFTILIGLEKRVGWLFGFVAAVIGVLLYVVQDAWLMASLNAFYAAMGIYGWWSWGRDTHEQRIVRFGWRKHVVLIAIGLATTALLALAMRYLDVPGKYHSMEAFISAFAIIATWMMSAKALENWFYWSVGDLLAVAYNHLLGYDGYALLNMIYIILAVAGLVRWHKQWRAQERIG